MISDNEQLIIQVESETYLWGMMSLLLGRYGCIRATAYAQPNLNCIGCRVLHGTIIVIDHNGLTNDHFFLLI